MLWLSQSTHLGVSFLKNHVHITNSFRNMIEGEFQNFRKINQVQVPASHKTMDKIKKTCYITLKMFETSSIMFRFVIKYDWARYKRWSSIKILKIWIFWDFGEISGLCMIFCQLWGQITHKMTYKSGQKDFYQKYTNYSIH